MVRVYPITYNGQRVGTAEVKQQGLFLVIHCECDTDLHDTYSIVASSKGKTVELGCYVPGSDGCSLERRISVKHISGEEITFLIAPVKKEMVVPVYTDKPFPYLSQLSSAHFAVKNNQASVTFTDQMSISRPTGQWSEPMTSE